MIVQLSIIPKHRLQQAQTLAADLERAVQEGAVSRVDELSKELAGLAEATSKTSLIEPDWRELNRCVRVVHPSYLAGYLLPPEACAWLKECATGTSLSDVASLLERAMAAEEYVMQSPREEET